MELHGQTGHVFYLIYMLFATACSWTLYFKHHRLTFTAALVGPWEFSGAAGAGKGSGEAEIKRVKEPL